MGSTLIERLRSRGDEVTCIAKDRLNLPVLEALGVRVALGDLNQANGWDDALAGVECVYHLAGVTRAQSSREYYEGNHLATRRLLELCLRHGPRLQRFLYVSSLAAVGPAFHGQPVDETTPYHPVSHYGRSKMRGEMEVLQVRDRLPITIVRPSAVYGPRERDMYEYIKLIAHGIQPLIGFRRKLLNLVHSADLVEGILLAAASPRAIGETYFLGSAESYTTEEIGEAVANVVHSHPLRIHVPHLMVYGIGALAQAAGAALHRQVFFNLQKARESVQPAWTCSVQKARSHLGFQPRLSLNEGMRITYRWYLENGWLNSSGQPWPAGGATRPA
ncbi:MAG: NAD-dependent epimerase/dehydratase family protein [Bryobacteraceae bacterium]